ncbi:hypothetical protein V8D89_006101 [Ganoderma adspersum]
MSTATRRPSMCALPDDLLLLIISFVDVRDILSLRRTSKRLFTMSKLRWVWYDAMKRHVIQKGLPIPAAAIGDLRALTAEHLEARAVHAAHFHNNWSSPHPVARKAVEFCAVNYLDDELPDEQRAAVTHVSFLPGRNGQYLITAVGRVLTCWEIPLGESEAYRVAEWVSARRIEQVVVNDDPKAEVVVAYVSEHPATPGVVECRGLAFDKFHGKFNCRMELRAHRQVVMSLHVLHSDYLIFGDPMHVCYLSSPTIVRPLGKQALAEVPDNAVLAVKPVNRYLLVVRQRTFEVTFAPSWKGIRTPQASLIASSMCIEMDLPATSSVIVFRDNSLAARQEAPDWPTDPVTVLSRYSDDGFDTMHQYDLLPNSKAESEDGPKCNGTMGRLPCVFPSQYTRVVSVAPSSCDLRVGPSGKGFWTETRNITLRHARTPARCLVGFTINPGPYDSGKKGDIQPASLELCQDVLYSRRCNIHEILWKKYMVASTALEDTVGRIAVGDVTGKVEVLDLA